VKTHLQGGWIDFLPHFLSIEEQNVLFQKLLEQTKWQQGKIKIFGKTFNTPRLEAFYCENGLSYSYSGQQLKSYPFTPLLSELKGRIEAISHETYNSVLINLYRDGSDSNGWHADNETELGRNPTIASLSLGIERRFDLKNETTGEKIAIMLNPGSLLIMGGELQHNWKHQIAKSKKIALPRINLTFRKVV
jgi:alkylated DNA repair dioxygenase AlkB